MDVRALKVAIVVMAVLIVVAVGAIVWAIVNLKKPSDNHPAAARSDNISLGLPAGCEIADMTLDGKRLAVRTAGSGADCARVYVVDVSSGRIVATVAR